MQRGSGSASWATGCVLLFACLFMQSLTLTQCQIKDRNVHDAIHGTGSLGRAPWRKMGDALHDTIPLIYIQFNKLEMAIEESLEMLKGAAYGDPDSRVDIQSEGSPTLLAATKSEASHAELLGQKKHLASARPRLGNQPSACATKRPRSLRFWQHKFSQQVMNAMIGGFLFHITACPTLPNMPVDDWGLQSVRSTPFITCALHPVRDIQETVAG